MMYGMGRMLDDQEADRLARAIAARTGETLAEAVVVALTERLERLENAAGEVDLMVKQAMEIADHYSSLPVLDSRGADEIMGYDERRSPH